MKILIIGLGSMGKRRVRNLIALGNFEIYGYDVRKDRLEEAVNLYGIQVTYNLDDLLKSVKFSSIIISVPPNLHHVYIRKSLEINAPCFVEASVTNTELKELFDISIEKNVLVAPSTTLHFHPAIKLIRDFLEKEYLGKITNVLYHSGQYLPDWHTYEKVSEYYVSNPETGGAREIIPFELTWMLEVLGFPNYVLGVFKKTINIDGAEKIDDTYNALLDYGTFIVNLTVDVVSRYATRTLLINGSEKQLKWDWNDNFVKIYDSKTNEWKSYYYEVLEAQEGYNKNITEQMYIDELNTFIRAVRGEVNYPNSLEKDLRILNVLYKIEESYTTKKFTNL